MVRLVDDAMASVTTYAEAVIFDELVGFSSSEPLSFLLRLWTPGVEKPDMTANGLSCGDALSLKKPLAFAPKAGVSTSFLRYLLILSAGVVCYAFLEFCYTLLLLRSKLTPFELTVLIEVGFCIIGAIRRF